MKQFAVGLFLVGACVPMGQNQGGNLAGPGGGGGASAGGASGAVTAVTTAQLRTAPIVITPGDRPLDQRIGGTGCSAFRTSQPIATIELREAIPKLKIRVDGVTGYNSGDGFVLRAGDQEWKACDRTGEMDAGSLPPGRYDVYPAVGCMKYTNDPDPNRPGYYNEVCHESVSTKISIYENTTAMPTDAVRQVALDDLTKPMFVEVALPVGRQATPNEIAGRGCESVAFTLRPDLVLDLPDPRKKVVVRVLPTAKPVRIRSQVAGHERYCGADERRYKHRGSPNLSDAAVPSYASGMDVGLGDEAEGKVALWLGSNDPAETTKVTLMITDATTKFEPLAGFDGGFPLDTAARRWVGGLFPQFGLATVLAYDERYRKYATSSALFAAVPTAAFIYAKRDIPSENGSPAIAKGEPLIITELLEDDGSAVRVMTADGLDLVIKANQYELTPPATLAFPTAPRPISADVFAMLPPEQEKKGEAYHAKFQKLEQCRDKAWAPYGAQLPTVSAGFVIASKSPEYVRIENAGHAAQDKKCGTSEQLEVKLAPERAKLQALVDAERARLLTVAVTPHLK